MTATLEPDTLTDTITDEEIEEFVRKMSEEDEPPCQYRADHDCTIKVTTRAQSCRVTKNFCEVGRKIAEAVMESETLCYDCRRRAGDCWVLRPI